MLATALDWLVEMTVGKELLKNHLSPWTAIFLSYLYVIGVNCIDSPHKDIVLIDANAPLPMDVIPIVPNEPRLLIVGAQMCCIVWLNFMIVCSSAVHTIGWTYQSAWKGRPLFALLPHPFLFCSAALTFLILYGLHYRHSSKSSISLSTLVVILLPGLLAPLPPLLFLFFAALILCTTIGNSLHPR